MWNFLWRNFYTKVASCYHNSISRFDNFINIINTFTVLNFGNDCNMLCMMLSQNLTNFIDTCCISDKRSGNKINILRNSKDNIIFIFFCNCRKFNFYIRHIDSFFLSKFSAIFNQTDNRIFLCCLYLEFNQTIINQNLVTFFYIFRKTRIGNRTSFFISHALFYIKSKGFSLF